MTTHYTVKRHDRLGDIAAEYLGDWKKWELIVAANPQVLVEGDPTTLPVGVVLHIPAVAEPIPDPEPEPTPIDDLKLALIDSHVGFAQGVTGGYGGEEVEVARPEELGEALQDPNPLWIVAAGGWEIPEIKVASDKTLVMPGSINGGMLNLDGCENVILADFKYAGMPEDAIRVWNGANKIWLHNLDLSGGGDGLIDVTYGATNVTVSHCWLHDHDKAMLLATRPGDAPDVTLHHNRFTRCTQRHPSIRYGRVHMFNNIIEDWGANWCAISRDGAQLLSEHNRWIPRPEGPFTALQPIKNESLGYIRSVGDVTENGATITEHQPELVFPEGVPYEYELEEA